MIVDMTANSGGIEVDESAGTNGESIGPDCPIVVSRPAMHHRWDLLTFLHWRYDPAVVQRLLPPGLTVQTFDGSAWVGLVPFMMQVRGPVGPVVPWASNFCETNVRTYVTAPDGTCGVWFLSLDAARFGAVAAARAGFALPYFWSKMSLVRLGDEVVYDTSRRWPGPKGARSRVRVEVGSPYAADELGPFDHFLSARWRLYSYAGGVLRSALAEHEPWPQHRVRVLECDDDLVAASGLSRPVGDPIAHWSPGVGVRIGLLHRVQC